MLAGVLLGLGASVSWALANVAVARSAKQAGVFSALLWSQLVGVALLAEFALYYDYRPSPMTATIVAWTVGAGFASLLAYVCLFYAFQHGRLSIAVPIMSSWAVISAGISVAVLGERVRAGQLVGAALVVLGVLLVSHHARGAAKEDEGGRSDRPRWLLASVGAAIGFGVLIPAIGQIASATGRLGSVCVVYVTEIALGLPLALMFRVRLGPPPASAWPAVFLAGLFETAGFACIALAVGRAPLALVSPLSSLASALTVLYAWLVLGDRPPLIVAMGAALACAGIVIVAI
ncbi:MAG TPA: DMT family transporter [Polyangia bacterium]|jgi:drug/metabolite transporter (DMT)-like permease|nr:DMT family transporter [Polyangia bacterium]